MKLHHVVDARQFTVPDAHGAVRTYSTMERIVARGGTLDYQNRIMASLFYQPYDQDPMLLLKLPCIASRQGVFPPNMPGSSPPRFRENSSKTLSESFRVIQT